MSELVSIIVPTFNSAKHIGKTIESILSQTYDNWEILVTDDCSLDDTRDIVSRYVEKDSRIKLYCLERNSGAGVARNNSLAHAQGRYIAFCDSDDYWASNKLERQIAFMKLEKCGIVYSSYYVVDDENRITAKVKCPRTITDRDILLDDSIGCLTMIYDASIAGKQEFPIMRRRQDWAMKILLMRRLPLAKGIDEPLAYYRRSKGSLSSNKLRLIKYNISVYRDVLHYPILKSYAFFLFGFMPRYIWKRLIMVERKTNLT